MIIWHSSEVVHVPYFLDQKPQLQTFHYARTTVIIRGQSLLQGGINKLHDRPR